MHSCILCTHCNLHLKGISPGTKRKISDGTIVSSYVPSCSLTNHDLKSRVLPHTLQHTSLLASYFMPQLYQYYTYPYLDLFPIPYSRSPCKHCLHEKLPTRSFLSFITHLQVACASSKCSSSFLYKRNAPVRSEMDAPEQVNSMAELNQYYKV